MIASFANQMTEDLFHGNGSHRLREHVPIFLVKTAERKLDILNAAEDLDSLRLLPNNRIAHLDHNAHGKYKMPIGEGWALAFRWNNEDAYDVEIVKM
jgi:proteic killer suppression protein